MLDCTGGLDVHAASVRVSAVRGDELVGEVTIPYDLDRIEAELLRFGVNRCCYEAGVMGFDLCRVLRDRGFDCEVIAPSLIPRAPGDRIKTDKRDARRLALLHQARMTTMVTVPDPDIEAVRDLLRARDDIRLDRTRCRHRMGKFLLRHGLRMPTQSWTRARRLWLGQQTFEHPARQRTFDEYLQGIDLTDRRLERIEADLFEYADHPTLKALVGRLRCIRGIDTLSALTLATEVGDFHRFRSAGSFMSYVGLVPTEHSSGDTRRQGCITKTGNVHLRRILIEAAWNNRRPVKITDSLVQRHKGQPPAVVQHSIHCQRRLHKRWSRMTMRAKPHNKIVCAVSRELAGFVWAIATYPVD